VISQKAHSFNIILILKCMGLIYQQPNGRRERTFVRRMSGNGTGTLNNVYGFCMHPKEGAPIAPCLYASCHYFCAGITFAEIPSCNNSHTSPESKQKCKSIYCMLSYLAFKTELIAEIVF
jgi:hypothetical protein